MQLQAHPKYRSDIDGLRAVAVLSVVGFHAFPSLIPGGFIGVDIFFVISGFLISCIIFQNLDLKQFNILDFYGRRIKRIFPALLLVLLVCLAFGWFTLLAGEYSQLGKHTAAGASFLSNFVLLNESGYFDTASDTKPLLHLWSLGIEEQFYIFWPLLAWIAWRFNLSLLATLLLCISISFGLNVITIQTNQTSTFYLPQTRVWELLIGAMVAWVSLYRKDYEQSLSLSHKNFLSFVGFLLVFLGLCLINKQSLFPGAWPLLPCLGAAFIIFAGEHAYLNKILLTSRPLVWVGLISFPLYLWHWPLLSFAHILEGETPSRVIRLTAVILAIIFAWLTYKLIERPIRFSKLNKTITVTLVILMLCVGASGYLIFKDEGIPSRKIVVQQTDPLQVASFASFPASQCLPASSVFLANNFCTKYSPPNPAKTLLLWGDSSTGAWLPVFQKIGYENGFAVINIMHPSCPPILKARKTRFDFPESRKYCSDGTIQDDVIALIRQLKPDEIIVIAAWNSYSTYSKREFLADSNTNNADSMTTSHVLETRIPETLRKLSGIAPTIIFKSWPILPNMPMNRNVQFLGSQKRVVSVSKKEFVADNAQINQIFDQIQDQNILFFDPTYKICQSDQCVSVLDGVNFYSDKYHITPQGTMQFKTEIEELFNTRLHNNKPSLFVN
jgi:peptidoglycan/LPS O-acetylase OafA/YrhL